MEYFEPINETSYLSVPNASVYRKIMRVFYREYEKMNFKLYKEDIFRILKQDEAFADYSMEQLVADLECVGQMEKSYTYSGSGKGLYNC